MLKYFNTARNYHAYKFYTFLNPFANHSYFTLYALSQHGSVFLFCPPLQIQLLLGRWQSQSISFAAPPLLSQLWALLAIISFLLFKVRMFTESTYLRVFRFLAVLYLRRITPTPILVYYQDYLADVLSEEFPVSQRICELIINSTPSQSNYESTLRCIQSATTLVIPSFQLIPLCESSPLNTTLAPYGGDKSVYLTAMSTPIATVQRNYYATFPPSTQVSLPSYTFKIAARAPSQRKGLDILLHSLLALDMWLAHSEFDVELNIVICGAIYEVPMLTLFSHVVNNLALRGAIRLKYTQFSGSDYLSLLAQADLFIMPSRLESSSLAALEALWNGVPSILTEACGINHFSHLKHGLLLPNLTPAALSESIQYFVESPVRLLTSRQHLTADRYLFSWNQYFTSYSNLLRNI